MQQNELRPAGTDRERRLLAFGGGSAQILECVVARVPAAELLEEVLRRRAEVARMGGRRADERDDAALAAGNPLEEGLDAPPRRR